MKISDEMKLLMSLIFSICILNCYSQKKIPLKGKYLESPYTIKTAKSFEETWSRLIDIFVKRGYSLKIIDKNSGLLMSDRIILKSTTEIKKSDKLTDTTAVIVVPQIYQPGPNRYSPITKSSDITGEWNIRLKTIDDLTVITVNVVNLKYQFYDSYYRNFREETLSDFKSTGVFEKNIELVVK